MLFGVAIGDGSIRSLDDSVTDYLPTLRGSAYDGVTIRQLLQMSSGVSWNEDYDDPGSDLNRFPVDSGIDGMLAYMKRLSRRAPPGTVFNYSTAETDIAGAVLRSAIGRPLAQYLSEKIWKPAGMEANAYWVTLKEADVERGGCCLSATLRDYGRLGLLALNDGVAMNGTRLLPTGWMATATTPAQTNPAYGFLWWLSSPPGRFWATGIYGQNIYIDPRRKVVIAIHSFWDRATTPELVAHRKAFREALAAAVTRNEIGTRSRPSKNKRPK